MSKAIERLEREAARVYTCHHCAVTDLTESEMEPLADGSPSNCCKLCWREFEEKRSNEIPDLLVKWHNDSIANQREAEHREWLRQASKKEKEAAEASSHTLTLIQGGQA